MFNRITRAWLVLALFVMSGCSRFSNPVAVNDGDQVVNASALSGCSSYFCSLDMGSKYWINNNTWGANSNGSNGWESIWVNSGSSWGSNWDWRNGPTGGIKSFPSCVLGWHWGWKKTGTGLPARIWDNKNVNTAYSFSLSGSNTMNVAYDCWFHTQSNPDWSNQPSDEMMIWLYKTSGVGPIGSSQGSVNLAGANWTLYKGVVNGWNVYSFVRDSNTSSATLNLRDFINHIVYARGWMSNSKYLTSVQAGAEVTYGNGQINVNNYYCNIQ